MPVARLAEGMKFMPKQANDWPTSLLIAVYHNFIGEDDNQRFILEEIGKYLRERNGVKQYAKS